MDNCIPMQGLISRMLDEDLTDQETRALSRHLETCSECRAMYEAFSGVSTLLKEDLAEPPESLCENVMGELRREQMIRRNRRTWRTVLTATAAVALLAVGLRAVGAGSDTVTLTAAAHQTEVNGTVEESSDGEFAVLETSDEVPMEFEAVEEEVALQAVQESQESSVADTSSVTAANRAAVAAAPGGGAADSVMLRIDLTRMDLAELMEALGGEPVRLALDLVTESPVCTLIAADGALDLFEYEGTLYCFSPDDGMPLRIDRSLDEIARLD